MGAERKVPPVRVGTSSGRRQSAVIVPVPAVEAVVSPWRARHDPVASAGVPAHVTLIVPWVPSGSITPDTLRQLEDLVAATPSWEFRLTGVKWFGERVLWLAPDPSDPFCRLTQRLADHFGTPPWEGRFDDLVPHLTIGHAEPGCWDALDDARNALSAALPLAAKADEVWVMCGDGRRWSTTARIGLDGRGRLDAAAGQPMASKMAFSSSEGPAGTV